MVQDTCSQQKAGQECGLTLNLHNDHSDVVRRGMISAEVSSGIDDFLCDLLGPLLPMCMNDFQSAIHAEKLAFWRAGLSDSVR